MKKITVLILALLMIFTMQITSHADAINIVGPGVIHKEKNQALTMTAILGLYESDVMILEDNYTGYGNIPGIYTLTLKQNTITKEIEIHVLNDWGNLQNSTDVICLTDYKDIHIVNDRILTPYEIVYYLLMSTGYFENTSQFYYESLIDTYSGAVNEDGTIDIGMYEFSFKATFFTGYEATYHSDIYVIQAREISGSILEPPTTNADVLIKAFPWFLGVVILIYLFSKRKKKNRGYDF
ncbi:MAG: hypothetical protein K8Q99_02085 [Acholeplasmataceae bacterium]|nr:hypothetical protein [Acholeplasmataceae bacterium]MCD4826555.1 hypothetical protein [Acholeplasmataceae bacterium]